MTARAMEIGSLGTCGSGFSRDAIRCGYRATASRLTLLPQQPRLADSRSGA
jgi:hypothetical protein